MSNAAAIWSLLVATLLGLLIGFERERKRETRGSIFAGIRTFPLIALLGAISGQLSREVGSIVVALGLAVLGVLLGLAYWRSSAGEKVGGTSEIAALVTFGLGVLAGLDHLTVAIAGAVIATGILSLRDELRHLSQAVSREDLFATVQFAAVSLLILPLVPDRPLGPWKVWNPHTIWLQVVLISGISFIGYFAAKLVGTARSIGLGGVLGGLVSSTAVTLSYSKRSRTNPALSRMLAAGVLLASAVIVMRILVLIKCCCACAGSPGAPAVCSPVRRITSRLRPHLPEQQNSTGRRAGDKKPFRAPNCAAVRLHLCGYLIVGPGCWPGPPKFTWVKRAST